MAQLKSIPLATVVKPLKGKVHLHKPPRCTGKKHDASCGGRAGEVTCRVLHVPGHDNDVCLCVHIG